MSSLDPTFQRYDTGFIEFSRASGPSPMTIKLRFRRHNSNPKDINVQVDAGTTAAIDTVASTVWQYNAVIPSWAIPARGVYIIGGVLIAGGIGNCPMDYNFNSDGNLYINTLQSDNSAAGLRPIRTGVALDAALNGLNSTASQGSFYYSIV